MKILYSFLVLSVFVLFTACEKNQAPIFDGEFLQMSANTPTNFAYPRLNDGMGLPSGFTVILAGSQKSSPVNYTFEIDSSSTAIENLHYTLDATSGSIPANESIGEIPITILDDNIEPGEVLSIVINLTSADVSLSENYKTGTHNIQVLCETNVLGTYNYVHTDNFTGMDLSGTGEITRFGTSETEYQFSDFSFGAWDAAYGIDPPSGSLRFNENCGIVSITGTDNYGDNWSMTDIFSSGGPEFSFRFENTYGEFGTVTLTRQDGSDWPTFVQ
ncbi:MAG: hypothetical protein HKN09_13565 [Saprospiraceae bacterium]|nr:hypothetical protein [Saprospiraceae bacterium]